jgi:hypothetical protein
MENKDKQLEQSKDVIRLNHNINRLNTLIEKRLSFWRNFFLGVVTGVGSVIGATIIGGILIGFLVANIDKLDDIPLIRRVVDSEDLERYIEE